VAIFVALALVGAACGGDDATAETATTAATAPTTTAPSETTTPALQSDLGEFSPFGAGTYTMVELGIPVTFTVSEQWFTQPVGPGFFVITAPSSAGPGDHDLVFLRSAALFGAGGEPVLAADDLEGWLATVPDTASVSEPTPTTVAGLDAVTFEVTVETEVPLLLAGAEGAEFFKAFQPGFLFEVFWIRQPDGQPIVVVNGTPDDDPGGLEVARGVVATLKIG
jgi:hypothetical protein